jgi:DNA-binding GntR family transcriptional regulator
MGVLKPLHETVSLEKLAYDRIKDAILTFGFMPNQALVEGDLALQLGISKTPVRDALMRLEREGLVSRIPFKGTYVSDINNQDMADIYTIRAVLEGLAIRLATEFITPEEIERLDELTNQHAIALSQKDFSGVAKINAEFHGIILRKCNNQRLIKNLEDLDDLLKRYRLLSIVQGVRLEKSVPEHKAIVAALKEHDPLKAEMAMKEHLQSAMKDLYKQDFSELELLVSKVVKK